MEMENIKALKALIVDDVPLNRAILGDILEDDFEIIETQNGLEALEIIENNPDDINVLLLDLVMPKLDGFGVLEKIKEKNILGSFPIIIITEDTSTQVESQCLSYGVTDFIKKPFTELAVKYRVKNAVELYSLKNNLEKTVANQTKTILENSRRLEKLNEDIINLLGNVVEARNRESGLHVKRVQTITEIIAKDVMEYYPEYGLTERTVEVIRTASALHDVGKIMISDSILLKPGKLTKEEFELMKQHSVLGVDLLKKATDLWDGEYAKANEEICHYHHERYDGRGYPDGLKGEEIPISAQIVSIADAYDALITKRVYKDAFPKDVAFKMIINGECGVFSPKLLVSFERCRQKLESLVPADE